MNLLERHLEQLLVNFPNLVSSYLWGRKFPEVNEFGEVNVCVRQGELPECNGRVDLAFVTEQTIHVVELKRGTVSGKALKQLKRYLNPIQQRCPDHLIIGYLAGRRWRDWFPLRDTLSNERIRVLLVGQEIPREGELLACENCRAGFHYAHAICPYCEAEEGKALWTLP
jgi:hypothetical protein